MATCGDSTKNAIDTCELAGHQLYTFRPTTSISDTTVLKLTLRSAFSEKWNKEVVWGSTHDVGALQKYCMPHLVVNNLGNGTNEICATLKIAEQFYTENGIPIDEDPSWDYENRYDTQKVTDKDKFYLEPGEVTAKLHFNREPRFYATLGFDRSVLKVPVKLRIMINGICMPVRVKYPGSEVRVNIFRPAILLRS